MPPGASGVPGWVTAMEVAMNQSQNENTVSTRAAAKGCNAFLSALGDVGVTWAAYGLKVGKMALETSAETLGRTAKALEALAAELARKAAAEKAAVEAAGAPVEEKVESKVEPQASAPVADAPSA
jgi:hypothetical protein